MKYLRKLFARHKDHLPVLALLTGLVWDLLTLGRPDGLFENAVMLGYLTLAGVAILLLCYRRERRPKDVLEDRFGFLLLLFIQFTFGNLTSGLFVLYTLSGTLAGSWMFFLMLIALLVGNEFLRSRYDQLRFNLGIYYLLVLAYVVIAVPILVREMGVLVFLGSGLVSIAVITLFIGLVQLVAPKTLKSNRSAVVGTVLGIFAVFNALFFLNLIPPVPLALKHLGIYHDVERVAGAYVVRYEPGTWYELWKDSDTTFHAAAGDRAYCLSAVFAPPRLATTIYHHWEYFDQTTSRWQTASRSAFDIEGGRDGGYRVYSWKLSLTDGSWRCSVETEGGALIGRDSFQVVGASERPVLVEETR